MRYDSEKSRVVYEPVGILPRTLVPKVIGRTIVTWTMPTNSRIQQMPEIRNYTLNFGPNIPLLMVF